MLSPPILFFSVKYSRKSWAASAGLCAAVLLTAATARGDYETQAPATPDPVDLATGPITFPGGVILRNLALVLHPGTTPIALAAPGSAPYQVNSFFDVFTEISLDNGANWTPPESALDVPVTISVTPPAIAGGTYNTQITLLNITGLPDSVLLRADPTSPSNGQTTITDEGGGNYKIDSFFDVFFDVSLDGGSNWTPATGSVEVVGLPEPASLLLLAPAALALLRRRRK